MSSSTKMCECTYTSPLNSYVYNLRVLTVNISEQLGTLIFGLSLLGMEWAGARELTMISKRCLGSHTRTLTESKPHVCNQFYTASWGNLGTKVKVSGCDCMVVACLCVWAHELTKCENSSERLGKPFIKLLLPWRILNNKKITGGGSKDYKLIFYCDSRKMWAWKSPNICFCVLKKQIVSEKFQ